ncbi:MAG: molybdopterin synthase catalytic subunit MoaE [Gammaproteobacteria bacterium]|nr:molybdopterin synthase catalytic subunit MoaE [Gammaproteobacteria bacterium]|tara:strand:- start:468 stop:932 length:465 start_codon:yes stop_codon:yes gene_type:complete
MSIRVSVQEASFDSGEEIKGLGKASREIGGISVFVGVVRDINDDDSVQGLYLEHYSGMTEKQIGAIIDDAAARWDVKAATVIHRIGQLYPGDEIVFVGVASDHRGDAFDACEFIIDYLKTRATFWKKETTDEGNRWLSTRDSDIRAADLWESQD